MNGGLGMKKISLEAVELSFEIVRKKEKKRKHSFVNSVFEELFCVGSFESGFQRRLFQRRLFQRRRGKKNFLLQLACL